MTLQSRLFATGLLLLLAATVASAHHDEACEFRHTPDTYVLSESDQRDGWNINPPPPLRPGEMSQLRWADDGEAVHDYSFRIGLPASLRKEVYDYADRMGIIEATKSLVNGDEAEEGGARAAGVGNFTEAVQDDGNRVVTMRNGIKWFFNRPGEHFALKSNQWWADPANERGHEDMLRVLAKGGFDSVLEAIGNRFEHLDGLAVEGLGFIGVSHCIQHHFHQDFFEREGRIFGVLVPIILGEEDIPPSERQPELAVETRYDDGTKKRSNLNYEYETAFMTGDGFWHSTNTVDYRESGGFRLTLSVFVADVTYDLKDLLARDETALYVQGQGNWLYAQRGRHWTRPGIDGVSNSLKEDKGRQRFTWEDRHSDCEGWAREGLCDLNARRMYRMCAASCGVFMDDEEYFSSMGESIA